MTAILKDLRSLKAARDRGEITQEQFARAEAMLHDLIEDAVVDAPAPEFQTPAEPPRRRATDRAPERPAATPARIWETGLMVVAGLASLTMLVAVLVGSMTLALTLLVTVIAAISVRAVKMLDD